MEQIARKKRLNTDDLPESDNSIFCTWRYDSSSSSRKHWKALIYLEYVLSHVEPAFQCTVQFRKHITVEPAHLCRPLMYVTILWHQQKINFYPYKTGTEESAYCALDKKTAWWWPTCFSFVVVSHATRR